MDKIVKILPIISAVIIIILFWVNWFYPTYIENPSIDIIKNPYGIYNDYNSGSELGINVKNIGKPHFNFCLELSSDENLTFRQKSLCYEFFNKGEEKEIDLSLNEADLFKKNLNNFTLTFSSNINWEYDCFLVKEANNFYKIKNCVYK